MKKLILTITIVLLVSLALTQIAAAHPLPLPTFTSPIPPPEPLPPPPPLTDILAKLATGIGTGAILAFLFENFEWFQNLSTKTKWWVVLITTLTIPMIARALLDFVPLEIWLIIEPYWQSLARGFLTWMGTQITHIAHKLTIRRLKTK
jgi:hypothetical protein